MTAASGGGAEIEISIEALGARGDGIGRDPAGAPVFVAGALPGERVRVVMTEEKGGRSRARLAGIVTHAPSRAAPPCPHFGTCGGCAAQHMDGVLYEAWKRGLVTGALARAGIAGEVAAFHRLPAASRRRARLFAERGRDGVALGFQAAGSHRVIDMMSCPALTPRLFELAEPLRTLFAGILEPGARAEAELQLVDGAVDLVVRLGGGLGLGLRQRLAGFAEAEGIARIGWQALARGRGGKPEVEVIAQRAPLRVVFNGISVAVPPLAFLQASREGEAVLTHCVAGAVPEGATVADLHCGLGTFTFALAPGRRVSAFDGAADMISALDAAARAGNLAGRVTAAARDLERRPLGASELGPFEAVVFDPPRGGATAQAREIAASTVPLVVAVSCNPASFARDAKTLIDGGYAMGPITAVDQFVWTRHLELVAVFRR